MQLAVAPFMGNFSVSVLCIGPKRHSVYMHVISWANSLCHRHQAFEFSMYVVIQGVRGGMCQTSGECFLC